MGMARSYRGAVGIAMVVMVVSQPMSLWHPMAAAAALALPPQGRRRRARCWRTRRGEAAASVHRVLHDHELEALFIIMIIIRTHDFLVSILIMIMSCMPTF